MERVRNHLLKTSQMLRQQHGSQKETKVREYETLFTSTSEILWSRLAVFNGGFFVQVEKYLYGVNIPRRISGHSKNTSLNANIHMLCDKHCSLYLK